MEAKGRDEPKTEDDCEAELLDDIVCYKKYCIIIFNIHKLRQQLSFEIN